MDPELTQKLYWFASGGAGLIAVGIGAFVSQHYAAKKGLKIIKENIDSFSLKQLYRQYIIALYFETQLIRGNANNLKKTLETKLDKQLEEEAFDTKRLMQLTNIKPLTFKEIKCLYSLKP